MSNTLFSLCTALKLIILIAMLTLSSQSFALGKLGHQLTCELAFEQLSSSAQQKLMSILNSMPEKEQASLNKYNYRDADEPISFAKACTWADAIKREPQYDKFKSWHYINVPRDKLKVTPNSCKKNCVTNGISVHQGQLKKADSIKEQRNALMFLGHWVGDIHQPLHVSFASDLGGNKTQITSTDKKCTNLHWLWDQCLLTRQIETKDHQKRYDDLKQKLSTLLASKKQAGEITTWQNSTVFEWANESLAISTRDDFGYCKLVNGACEVIKNSPQTLNEDYQTTFAPIINEQIIKASVRLSGLLESSL